MEALTDGFSGDDLRRFAREVAFLHFNKFKLCSFYYSIGYLHKFHLVFVVTCGTN